MVDSREKGKRAEYAVRDILRSKTKLQWERVPGSGGFGAQHSLKGDIYLPPTTGRMSKYAIEVKHYKDDTINANLFRTTSQTLDKWIEQAYREADEMNMKMMLVFKKDRGKWLVALDAEDFKTLNLREALGANPMMFYQKAEHEVVIADFQEVLKNLETDDLVK